jgi:hypothetical protein
VPDPTAARDLLDRFHRMIRQRADKDLDDWLADAKAGSMSSFATGTTQPEPYEGHPSASTKRERHGTPPIFG